jgi:hypothetical protein
LLTIYTVIVFDCELANAIQGITTSSFSVTFCKPFTQFKAYSKYEGTASEFLSFNIGNNFQEKGTATEGIESEEEE